jgi:Transposase
VPGLENALSTVGWPESEGPAAGSCRGVARNRREQRLQWSTAAKWLSPSCGSLLMLVNAIACCCSRHRVCRERGRSSKVRLLDSTRTDKTDSHDARAAAIVALRHPRLRPVTVVDHSAVLRLLASRHHDLTALRTQAVCRLHALLCQLTPGGAAGRLSATRAGEILRRIRALEPVTDGRVYYQRKLAEGKTRKEALRALKRQISNAVYRRLVADTHRSTAGPGGQTGRL